MVIKMKRLAYALAVGAALLAPMAAYAQSTSYQFLRSGDMVQDKNFYLLTVLNTDERARASLLADPVLLAQRQNADLQLNVALTSCTKPVCVVDRMMLSDGDIKKIGDAFGSLANGALKSAIRDHLRPSGMFQRHAALDDKAFIQAAWIDTAAGMNRLYRVYATGEVPRYRDIDSISYKVDDERFFQLIRTALETADDGLRTDTPFFGPWAQVGLDMLLINQRDEAGRYEPLVSGENGAASQRAAKVIWRDFAYSAILIPGAGLRNEERGLSAIGSMRLRLAVRRYQKGLAPFIVVSGGNVHPNKTPYNEALEMKRVLMGRYNIPENAIFIDPHARHTTTNLRNASRILFRAGAPMDRDVLVTTSQSQSAYIEGEIFKARNLEELGYQPMTFLRRVSTYDVAMRPAIISLYADPLDPLDP
jgi:hypothetical protein